MQPSRRRCRQAGQQQAHQSSQCQDQAGRLSNDPAFSCREPVADHRHLDRSEKQQRADPCRQVDIGVGEPGSVAEECQC
ncbi:MAG: hypothetical protein Ct9H300mP1_31670 [Planctomycetaceae bacterium]|nr:MAG: hypothetical protein Ct9H300mP1_31670 [Planctomycetaceae bacterium]